LTNTNTFTTQQCVINAQFNDGVKVLRPTRHKMGHFGDVLPSQSLGLVLNN